MVVFNSRARPPGSEAHLCQPTSCETLGVSPLCLSFLIRGDCNRTHPPRAAEPPESIRSEALSTVLSKRFCLPQLPYRAGIHTPILQEKVTVQGRLTVQFKPFHPDSLR